MPIRQRFCITWRKSGSPNHLAQHFALKEPAPCRGTQSPFNQAQKSFNAAKECAFKTYKNVPTDMPDTCH